MGEEKGDEGGAGGGGDGLDRDNGIIVKGLDKDGGVATYDPDGVYSGTVYLRAKLHVNMVQAHSQGNNMWKSKSELCTHGKALFHAAHVCN